MDLLNWKSNYANDLKIIKQLLQRFKLFVYFLALLMNFKNYFQKENVYHD